MMNNYDKYHFADFTLENYRKLLSKALKEGYTFSDYNLSKVVSQKTIIWRHDVEFSVQRAMEMAQIEQDVGVRAHYFVQLHSEFYNTFERDNYRLFLQIRDMGHFIGLHFDAQFWDINSQEALERGLMKDKCILEDLLETQVSNFSYHNTSPMLLKFNDLYYAGMLNVYAKEIRQLYRYCTDSTGIWRFERLEEVLQDDAITHLQVLTHDGMWQDQPMSPRKRAFKCINNRAQIVKDKYDKLLSDLGQLNIDDN